MKLATAYSYERIKKSISDFYCCKPDDIELDEKDTEWLISVNGREIPQTHVVPHRGGYLFKSKEDL